MHTVLRSFKASVNAIPRDGTTHCIVETDMFKCDPDTLNERAKAAPEEGDTFSLVGMGLGRFKCIARALKVIRSTGILCTGHVLCG